MNAKENTEQETTATVVSESVGHLSFAGRFEFFEMPSGDVYRAPATAPLDINGYRMSARWEGPGWWWIANGNAVEAGIINVKVVCPPVSECLCPDDCNCHHPWRTNYCGCKAH